MVALNINFNSIGKKNSKNTIINPTELFNALPKKYEYLRDVQSQVLEEWYEKRESKKDTIIKMNTGGGKTLVSLLILKSSLNEKKGPAIYVVPNNFLKEQVKKEAINLGIEVTDNDKDPDFYLGKSILVINSHQLFNGKSKFKEGEIGTILFDDVHAILSILEEQFTIKLSKDREIYTKILSKFETTLKEQDPLKYEELKYGRLQGAMVVPFWIWQKKCNEVFKLLLEEEEREKKGLEEKEVTFKIDLVKENLKWYECIIDKNSIEITFDQIPIDTIQSYQKCERRIFTTATLANDNLLSSYLNLSSLDEAITPKTCSDIGERMILTPKLMNPNLNDDEIKLSLKEKSKDYNVIVLVSSIKKANEWKEYADLIVEKENIKKSIEDLKNRHVGLVVLVNRYEGIDLPNEMCRILVIDDLPKVERKYAKLIEGILGNNIETMANTIQKIEQGMGRGVRSSDDYCVVILLGDLLTDLIVRNKFKLEKLFSVATLTQYEVSMQLMEAVKSQNEVTIEVLNELMDYCLKRNKEWIQSLKGELADKKYDRTLAITSETKLLRECYDLVLKGEIELGVKKIIKFAETNLTISSELKGLLLQKAAKYFNSISIIEAQNLLNNAHIYSKLLVNPIEGIKKQRKIIEPKPQVDLLIEKLKDLTSNEYSIKMNTIRINLNFDDADYNSFEEGIMELGELLGFPSIRPDKDKGKGPDNLWAITPKYYLVIECKNEAKSETISKNYCNQLSGSIHWFEETYNLSNRFEAIPIIIHPSNYISKDAYPNDKMRCIDKEKLELLKENTKELAKGLSMLKSYNQDEIFKLLNHYHFDGENFIKFYTKDFIRK
ncbi:MAG: DEAD/DEAH box helicase family protein [Fusobacterium perfoetens]|uniref:DEAD/DEAH box helicase family protein n=1 Tax=Fusobacterium perfoetens TaxID=852 RepID=UPI0023F54544|nr:DEAD/DEAH box helicase family protein [Fusobacterium perfoetens]MCI6152232.1 DEAD/DEAH box helicase family protein [Fusobacterium perfoetens]MDY3237496.1 DEAD/DEAH box helicase family protein [Fusobacterium perfoetens]